MCLLFIEIFICWLVDSQPVACDILPYWQQKSEVWPRLCSVARNLLSVPTASTSFERSFSVAGRTIEDCRCQLKTDKWHCWWTDVPSQPSTLTVTTTVLDRQWTILVIMHCSGLDKCWLYFWKGFYKISYALCTYVSLYGFLLYLSWILQVWHDFVGRNMNRHRKLLAGTGQVWV